MQQSPHWLQWNAPNSPQNCPFPFNDHHPRLMHPSIDRPHFPSQTTSGSTQPFCHSILSGQTDNQTHRPTDGLGECSIPIPRTLAILIDSDALKIIIFVKQVLPRVIWEEQRRKVPFSYNGTLPIHPKSFPFPFDDHHPSNTPIPRPTPLTIPNGIQI